MYILICTFIKSVNCYLKDVRGRILADCRLLGKESPANENSQEGQIIITTI